MGPWRRCGRVLEDDDRGDTHGEVWSLERRDEGSSTYIEVISFFASQTPPPVSYRSCRGRWRRCYSIAGAPVFQPRRPAYVWSSIVGIGHSSRLHIDYREDQRTPPPVPVPVRDTWTIGVRWGWARGGREQKRAAHHHADVSGRRLAMSRSLPLCILRSTYDHRPHDVSSFDMQRLRRAIRIWLQYTHGVPDKYQCFAPVVGDCVVQASPPTLPSSPHQRQRQQLPQPDQRRKLLT